MTHLSREELRHWWETGDPSNRERVTAHLAICDTCVALYGEVMDERPLESPAAPIAPSLVAAAYDTYESAAPRSLPRVRAWRRPWVAALGAAAALVLAIGLYSIRRQDVPLVDPLDETVRSTLVQPVSPAGRVAPPIVFAWSSPLEASAYELVIYDASGQTVWTTKVETTRVEAPADLLQRLRPGVEHMWQVTAINARGERTIQSPKQSFVLARTSG